MFVMSFRILASQAKATSGILMISGSVRLGGPQSQRRKKAWNNGQLAGQAAAIGTTGQVRGVRRQLDRRAFLIYLQACRHLQAPASG